MFSNPVKTLNKGEMPSKALWWLAAGLAFAGLLAALVTVVNGQVERARHRDAQYNAAQVAIADCASNHGGLSRSQCIDQVNASLSAYPAYATEPQTYAVPQPGNQGRIISATPAAGGFMSASFAGQ